MGAKIGILVAVMAVVGANYSMNSRVSVHDSSTAISNAQYQVLARNAALTGFERMKQHLSTSFSSTNLTGTVDGIAYSTTVKVAGDVARITSIGNYRGPRSGDQETYIIKSEFTRTAGTASKAELPAYMNYALLAEDDLRLSGNAGAAYIYSSGAGSSELNANFHTNGDLTVNGKGNARMQGFGTYVGSASGNHRNTKFQPNYNPNGESHTYRAGSVDIPEIDIAAITSQWIPDYTINNGSVSGIQTFVGTRDKPAIVHVPGNLDISGMISGYVVFLVDGDVTVSGNTTVGTSGYLGSDESSVAVYASGDFDMSGGADFWGQVRVNGDFTMGGNARLYGSATSRGSAWLHGTPDIYYREASNALTQVFESKSGAPSIEMTAYAEF